VNIAQPPDVLAPAPLALAKPARASHGRF